MASKKYGAWLSVAASVLITSYFWFDRANPHIRTQDVAECYASVIEKNVAYQTGHTNTSLTAWPIQSDYLAWYEGYYTNYEVIAEPPYIVGVGTKFWNEYEGRDTSRVDLIAQWLNGSTNGVQEIGNVPYWSLMYNRVIQGAKAYITASNVVSTEGIKIYWTDKPFLNEGDTIASADMDWYIKTNINNGIVTRIWDVTNPSNAVNLVDTSDTRLPTASTRYLPWIASTNLPWVRNFWPSTNTTLDYSTVPFGGTGNWWTAKGLSTNVYQNWCEKWLDMEDTIIGFTTAYSGFDITNSVAVPYGDTTAKACDIRSIDTNTATLNAAIYTASADGFASETIVLSDGGGSAWSLGLDLPTKYLALTEGGSANLQVRLTANPGGIVTVPFSVSGVGITVAGYLYFGTGNWNTYQTLAVSAPQDGDVLNGAAIITLTYAGVSYRIGVGVTDDDGTPSGVRVTPPIRIVTKGAVGTINVGLGSVSTNAHLWTDKRMAATNLYEAKTMLNGLKRTIAFVPASCLTFTNGVHYGFAKDLSENDGTGWTVIDGASMFDKAQDYDMDLEATTNAVTSYSGLFSGMLRASRRRRHDIYSGVETYQSAAFASFDADQYHYQGCALPYPSAYACSNGYVARVAVYAIAYGDIPRSVPGNLVMSTADEKTYTINGYNYLPDAWDAWNYGSIGALSLHAITGAAFVKDTDEDFDLPDNAQTLIDCYRVTKLVDVSNPSTVPLFDLGEPFLHVVETTDATSSDESYAFKWNNTPPDDPDWQYFFFDTYKYANTITLFGFVVMVDWQWQHCADDKFVTESNTPDWTKPQPNTDWKTNYLTYGTGGLTRLQTP